MLDVFANNPAFSISGLTDALIRMPFRPGLIGALALFIESRIATTNTAIEVQGTRLALVPDLPRGAPPTPDVEDRRFVVPFSIPHFPIRNTILADAVQNLRAFGTEDQLTAVQSVIAERQTTLSHRLDDTLEWLRLGAVKGTIITAVDRDTGVPLRSVDLFQRFEVPRQEVLEWPIRGAGRLGQENPAWAGQLTELVNDLGRAMANELGGGAMTGFFGVCGAEFWNAVTQHPECRAAYIALTSAPILDPNLWRRFRFRDMEIQEYRGQIGGVPHVASDTCHFFPMGVTGLFREIYAPGDYLESVNRLALPRYAKMEIMEFDKGVQLEAQMNVLPICTAPRVLFTVRVTDYVRPEGAEAAQAQGAATPGPARNGNGGPGARHAGAAQR